MNNFKIISKYVNSIKSFCLIFIIIRTHIPGISQKTALVHSSLLKVTMFNSGIPDKSTQNELKQMNE